MARIAVIAMSAKPITSGHFKLITIASRECDQVRVFVSLNDRKRKNEIPIFGDDMDNIWRNMIERSLPKNVKVTYVRGSTPISRVYEFLGKADKAGHDDTYVIYSDVDDIKKNFPAQSLEKYLNDLYLGGKLVLEPISRSETVDVSGTKMRAWLRDGDKDNFIAHLPDIIQDRGDEIWRLLNLRIALER